MSTRIFRLVTVAMIVLLALPCFALSQSPSGPGDAAGKRNLAPAACTDWNLASDLRRYPDQENPNRDACGSPGVWQYTSADLNRQTYTLLSHFTPNVWSIAGLQTYYQGPDYLPNVALNGTGHDQFSPDCGNWVFPANAVSVHPSPWEMAVVAWHSPVDGVVAVTGSVSDLDSCGGDGILWYIDRDTASLASGSIPNGGAQDFGDGTSGNLLAMVSVRQGETLYFAVGPGAAGDHRFDSTRLEISIHLLASSPVVLAPAVQTKQGGRGQVLTYQEMLSNHTGVTDTFSLALGSHAWDSALSAGLVGPLADGGALTVTIYVTVPVEAPWYSTDVLTLTATSVASPTVGGTATLTTRAYTPSAISISPGALTSTQYVGQVVTKALTIANGSGVTLTYDIGSTPVTGTALLLHLDEATDATTFRDDSGRHNDGSCSSCPQAGVGGVSGSAVHFDGSDDYIKVGSPVPLTLRIQNEIALEAWIYVTEYPSPDTLGTIVGCQFDSGTSGYAIHLDGRVGPDGQPAPDGHIHFQIGDGSFHTTNANAQVPLNEWVHVVAVRRANEDARIYYNGVQQPSTSVPWSGAISYGDAELDVGRQSDYGNRYFKGMIDEVAVHDRALSADEVLVHYERGLGRGIAVPWLSVTPISGTVPSDSSQAVSFTFDASGVGPGIYTTTVTIGSSDPLTPIVAVPVMMIVSSEPGRGWVAGTVGDDQGLGMEGVTITAGESITTTTDSSGRYGLYLPAGTYTLTASSHGFRFHPPRRVVTVPPDVAGQDFLGLDRWKSFLPSVVRGWPPLPDAPTLNPIRAGSFDSYECSWSTAAKAISYTLEEDEDGSFPHPTTVFSGDSTSWQARDKAPGTYCYRVRGVNENGGGPWSNVRCITIVQLRDDFSNLGSGWPVESDAIASIGYRGGEYRILVKQAGWVVRAEPGILVTDFRCEVDARNAAHSNGSYGIYFGASDPGYYLYEVAYGQFRLLRYDRPNRTWITLIAPTPHPAIHQGDQANRLQVTRRGAEITLYANGEQVGQTTEGALGEGSVGLAAGASKANYDARFDNFRLVYVGTATLASAHGQTEMMTRAEARQALGPAGSGIQPAPVEEPMAPAWDVLLR